MNCEQMTLLISAWLDGETTAQEEKQLLEHLEQCAPCRALLEQLQTLRASFSDLEESYPAPEGFADRVMEKVRAQRKPKVIPLFRRPQIRALTGLAACAVLCIGLMSGTGRKSAESTAAAPAAMAPGGYGMEADNAGSGLFDMDYSAKVTEEAAQAPMEKAVERTEMPTEPAMAPAAPAPGEKDDLSAVMEFDALYGDEAQRQQPTITIGTLPEGMEELGELRWEEHEDGTASVCLTSEQAQLLMALLGEQGLNGMISMPAEACEETWLLVLQPN